MTVVVGAGPAGIAAALRAHKSGSRVLMIDDNPAPGGQIWRGDRHNSQVARLRATTIEVLSNARVVSGDAREHWLRVETESGAHDVIYEKLILATGARELFLPFPGWTLPGVFGAGGLQVLAKSGLPVAGKRIVVAGSGPLLVAVAAHLRKSGAFVTLVAEQAPAATLIGFGRQIVADPAKIFQALGLLWQIAGVPYLTNCWIESAEGQDKLERVTLRRGNETWTEECDYAAAGFGLVPNDELARALGASEDIQCATTPNNGSFPLRGELKTLPDESTVVCRCENVSFGQLRSFISFRAAKLHARCGMGPCQGRVCGPATRFLFDWAEDENNTRPPVFPTRIGSLLAAERENHS